jgi:hypothetical protein
MRKAYVLAHETVELLRVQPRNVLDEEAETPGEVPFHNGLYYIHAYQSPGWDAGRGA